MFNKHDINRDAFMLDVFFSKNGYDWWWHSFTAIDSETNEEKPFFIEFFIVNPGRKDEKLVLGQRDDNKKAGKKPCYLMVKAGCWGEGKMQLHRFFDLNNVSIHSKAPYSIKSDDCLASEKRLKGSIHITKEESLAHPEWMCDYGDIEWDLQIDKKIAYNVGYGAGSILRYLKAFEMYWHAEGMKTLYSGTIKANGKKYIVKKESSYGYADKNWGSNFTSPWVWLSSNCMYSKKYGRKLTNSVFDIGGGKPKICGIALDRKLLGGIYYEGREYEFNFSKFWTGSKTKFNSEETDDEIRWSVIQENSKAIMITKIRCKKKDMLFVNYESPDGMKRHNRLWNGGNGYGVIYLYKKKGFTKELIDEIKVSHVGCEYGEYDDV